MVRRTGEGPGHDRLRRRRRSRTDRQGGDSRGGQVAAKIDHAGTQLEPGSTARVDVVVRTRKIGRFFPGGTVDAFDVWLELEAKTRRAG